MNFTNNPYEKMMKQKPRPRSLPLNPARAFRRRAAL